jgi:hypothetical protein
VLKNIYRLKPIHSHTQPQQQFTDLQHRIMQVWKPLPKLPALWREKYRLKYIMMKLQVGGLFQEVVKSFAVIQVIEILKF